MSSDREEEEDSFKIRKKKSAKQNSIRKRNHDQTENYDEEGLERGVDIVSASDIKRAKKMGKQVNEITPKPNLDDMTALQSVAYKTSGTAASLYDSAATRTIDVDGLDGTDSANVLAGDEAEKMDSTLYAGNANYKEFINKRAVKITQSNAGNSIRAGPLKGLSGVRISSRFDYAPAICKDYKETGFCGFGDSCVFMHDRGDYKMGWQLDKEWDEEQKAKEREREIESNQVGIVEVEDEVSSDDDLPFACLICRKDFTQPIITKCKHYFCERCALKQFSKTPACFACNANTMGVFDVAKDLKVRLERKKRRMEEREKELALAHPSGHDSDDDDDHDQDQDDA